MDALVARALLYDIQMVSQMWDTPFYVQEKEIKEGSFMFTCQLGSVV